MHLVIHTQYYPPEIGAPQARLSELAQGLVRREHKVTVLTGMPNYPQGRIYPGYGGLLKKEDLKGVHVIRTAFFPTQKASIVPRLISYFSFVLSSWLIGGWHLEKPTFIITESPPLFLGLSGYLLSRWKRARWIFNVSDLWPESIVRLGVLKDGFPLVLSYALEKFCYKKAWAVSGQSRTIIENIQLRFPYAKTILLSNGVDINLFGPEKNSIEAQQLMNSENHITAIYAGLHGLAQGLNQVLLASETLQDLRELKIVFVGDGPEKSKLVAKANELSLRNVHFLDPVPKSKIPALLAIADICIVPHKTFIPGAVPSKLYEAIATERPVVLVAEGEAAQIVNNSRCGLVVKPGDIEGLAHAIKYLTLHPEEREKMGRAGRQTALASYNREDIVESFASFLDG